MGVPTELASLWEEDDLKLLESLFLKYGSYLMYCGLNMLTCKTYGLPWSEERMRNCLGPYVPPEEST